MISYVVQRILIMVPTLIGISLITFIIIQLPPGDFLSTMIAECEAQGERSCNEQVEIYRQEFGLDKPMWQQYIVWVTDLMQGDLGLSFEACKVTAGLAADQAAACTSANARALQWTIVIFASVTLWTLTLTSVLYLFCNRMINLIYCMHISKVFFAF